MGLRNIQWLRPLKISYVTLQNGRQQTVSLALL